MSLFFNERIAEQKLDELLNEKITFIRPLIFALPPTNEEDEEEDFFMLRAFRTTHNVFSASWLMNLTEDFVAIRKERVQNYGCFVSYKLYYDNDMRFEFYSSNRVSAVWSPNYCESITPDGFMTKFRNAKAERRIKKIIVFVEIILPTKFFNTPFKDFSPSIELCDEYPTNMDDNFRFAFLKQSDFTIKCLDGTMPASKWGLNVTSYFMEKHFKDSKSNELIVQHRIDVIKPLVIYLHSRCFEMPKCFDFDFAERLLKAIVFFKPVHKEKLTESIHDALCKKFVEVCRLFETWNFNQLLRWVSISLRVEVEFSILVNMICTTIAQKHYYKWHETFPENAQNNENEMFRNVFGSEHQFYVSRTFRFIDSIFNDSLFTKAILH